MPTPPPKREGPAAIRRWFRSRKSFRGLTQWFIDTGLILFALFGVAFWLAWIDRGAREAYQVLLSMDPPWEQAKAVGPEPKGWHPLTWAASIIGWAAIPAIVGGAAGYIISKRIDGYIHTVVLEVFQRKRIKVRDALRLPPPIPWISDWPIQIGDAPTLAARTQLLATRTAFVDSLVQVAHNGDWRKAQNHWELAVAAYLNSPDFSEMGRRRKLKSSTSNALILMQLVIANTNECFICSVQKDSSFV